MSEGTATTPPQSPAQDGPRPAASAAAPATLVPESGWHVLHLFYRVDRAALAALPESSRRGGGVPLQLVEALTRREGSALEQLQCFAVPGHKADFGAPVVAGPDLRAVHDVQAAIESSPLGPALVPTYSFYSITEVSEYVPDAEQYAEVLKREGVDPESPTFTTKVNAYTQALSAPMNRQRLTPEFPDWPCLCFYPMKQDAPEGLTRTGICSPFETRAELMSQHGKSGMKFAGEGDAGHHRLDRPPR